MKKLQQAGNYILYVSDYTLGTVHVFSRQTKSCVILDKRYVSKSKRIQKALSLFGSSLQEDDLLIFKDMNKEKVKQLIKILR